MANETRTYPVFRQQAQQQQKTGPAGTAATAPPAVPTNTESAPTAAPVIPPTASPADEAQLGDAGKRALQALREEIKELKAANRTPDQQSAVDLAELRSRIEAQDAALASQAANNALYQAGIRHKLSEDDLAFIGTHGTLEEIASRAATFAARVAVIPGATPVPGLPGSPNAGQTGGAKTSSVSAGRELYQAEKAKRQAN